MSSPTTTPASQSTQQQGRAARTAAYYAAFVALGLASASLGPTLPRLAEQTHTNLSGFSFVLATGSLGYLLGSYQGGRLYDRRRGHPVMATMLVIMAAMLALTPLVPVLWLLAALRLILGMAEGALDVGGNALLIWVHGRQVGPFMNGLHFFFGVGAFIAPLVIVRMVAWSGGIAWAYWTLALLALPAAAWLLRLKSPSAPAAVKEEAAGLANGPLVALIAAFFFLIVAAELAIGSWLYTYAVATGASESTAAYLTATFWGAFTAGRLLGIPIAARFGPRSILFGDLAGCLLSVGAILLWPGSQAVMWLGTCGAGLAIASLFATTFSFAERQMPISGRVAGWFLVGGSAGSMVVPWVIGQLFERIGPRVTMGATAIDLVLAVGVLAAIVAYARRRGHAAGAPAGAPSPTG